MCGEILIYHPSQVVFNFSHFCLGGKAAVGNDETEEPSANEKFQQKPGWQRRNSDQSHLGLKMFYPRVQQSKTDKKGTDEPVNFGEAQIHIPFGAEGQPLKTTLAQWLADKWYINVSYDGDGIH